MSDLRLFSKALLGIYLLFAVIALSTSALCIHTIDQELSREYQSNSEQIAKVIADASVDVLLNRDLSVLQSLVDQYLSIRSIKYIYIADENGDVIVHTFVPQVPAEIVATDRRTTASTHRSLTGIGSVIEVVSPILQGRAGTVHLGMDAGLIGLKIQSAVGREIYLISVLFIGSILLTLLLIGTAARPLHRLLSYQRQLAGEDDGFGLTPAEVTRLLERRDLAGDLARLAQRSPSPPQTNRADPL
ncbi:MAG: hypothetical protein WCP04_09075 [Pseudomonadota bacterium]